MKDHLLRRWRPSLAILGLVLLGILSMALFWLPGMSWQRTKARRAWLVSEEAEIKRQIQAGRPAPVRAGPDNWFDRNFALFDHGWAAWRLNSFHNDPNDGGSWSGVGDIVILIDDQGKAHYSRLHFCDGTLGWALGYPQIPLSSRPANIDAFLALFKPGTWTDDRAAVEEAIAAARPAL